MSSPKWCHQGLMWQGRPQTRDPATFLPPRSGVWGPRKTVRGLEQHAIPGEGRAGGSFKGGTLCIQACAWAQLTGFLQEHSVAGTRERLAQPQPGGAPASPALGG